MTRATIHVQIPRPCGEAWEAMTPTTQGRHCAACQHTVTDFTQRTDAEILALLRQAAGGRVCGRFRAEQLDRALVHAPAAAPRWRAWVLAAAALWGLLPTAARSQELRSTHSGGPVPAGGGRTADLTEQLPNAAVSGNPDVSSDTTRKMPPGGTMAPLYLQHISGRVIEAHSGETMPGVTVRVAGTTVGVSTNADGYYELDAPVGGTLLFSSIGYTNREQPISAASEGKININMSLNEQALSGIVVTTYVRPWYSPRGLWYSIRSLPRRLTGRW
ncbi:carboxypeptidase-like regulatory domain-containing protein [Hymenobacter jeollabukensis]|uniref:Carboxypeptidase-like regulatory domain-containing protein n=1 Tax=Hymenobacter jeollabukensis TaxID=2025313 RepID=A0A5R8WHH2_9BACT|nr:carboxypeptidase-like regulatory domain-containing protein [Hymenobacter jeollabukensis]TLM87908.1 carboxypeptidase-like regulatory domain-containing protein [Hymenobacter jeollabukensis]